MAELECTKIERVFVFSYDEGTFVPLAYVVQTMLRALTDDEHTPYHDWQIEENSKGSTRGIVEEPSEITVEDPDEPEYCIVQGAADTLMTRTPSSSQNTHFVRCVLRPRINVTQKYVCSVYVVTQRRSIQRIAEDVRLHILEVCRTWTAEVVKAHNVSRPECCCECEGSGYTHKVNAVKGFRDLTSELDVSVCEPNLTRMAWMREMPLRAKVQESFMYASVMGVGWINVATKLPWLLCLCDTDAKAGVALQKSHVRGIA